MEYVTMPKRQLIDMIKDVAELTRTSTLAGMGVIPSYLSKQQAYKMYGMANVKRWFKEGLLTPIKDGQASAKWRIDVTEIEAVAKVSNRPSYMSVKERKV